MASVIIIGILALILGLSLYAASAKFDSDDNNEDKEE